MRMTVQKRLAARILKTSKKKVRFDASALSTIKDSITKADIRNLISSGVVTKKRTSHQSRSRANEALEQKRKGRRKGTGNRKGQAGARTDTKQTWINKIRAQRKFIKELKDKGYLDNTNYRALYAKCHGGYFRNVRHIKLYIDEHKMTKVKGE